MRIPFSSLRYKSADPQTWGILLYRNYPRGFRYQFASARFPRGGNCTSCRENRLTGLERLPGGGHLVAAPYLNASEAAHRRDGTAGAPLVGERVKPHAGFDVKYSPNADNPIDFAVKPDFSQVESDTAQISANERFALFFPEKRPFFLEGVDLFQTPIQAVYTRTITSPRWGGRLTGKEAGVRYTALVAEDAGGGRAILPGPNGSSSADQDFGSSVSLARAKRDIGLARRRHHRYSRRAPADRARLAGPGHLHVHAAHVRPYHRAIRFDRPRPVAVRVARRSAVGHVQRVGAVRLQNQLAVGDVHRLWRRARAGRRAAIAAERAAVFREVVVRVSALGRLIGDNCRLRYAISSRMSR